MNEALNEQEAWRVEHGRAVGIRDAVARETPVALVYNGVVHAVMMATPCDLEDFALGFSLSEGIVGRPDELKILETRVAEQGLSIQMLIPSGRFEALRSRSRQLAGRAGCGLCGIDSLEAAVRPVRRLPPMAPVTAAAIHAGLERLSRSQPWNDRCHGLHAAAFVHGENCIVREDVGRHNALDKLIGTVTAGEVDLRSGFLAMTSRASYEVVHKAANVGIGLLAAISAPTALAIQVAEEAGMTLVAFVRESTMTIYTGVEGIGFDASTSD